MYQFDEAVVTIIALSLLLVNCNANEVTCSNAENALGSNLECSETFGLVTEVGTTSAVLCETSCRNLINDVLDNCHYPEYIGDSVEQFCNDNNDDDDDYNDDDDDDDEDNTNNSSNSTVCITATTTLISNTDCIIAIADPDNVDKATACSATCKPLFEAVVDACGNTFLVKRRDIKRTCGGAVAVKGFGICGILLVAVTAVFCY